VKPLVSEAQFINHNLAGSTSRRQFLHSHRCAFLGQVAGMGISRGVRIELSPSRRPSARRRAPSAKIYRL